MINIDAVLRVVVEILDAEYENDPDTLMTPEMGATIRDHGATKALEAAALRRKMGEFHDLGRCAEFVVGKHRRRLRR